MKKILLRISQAVLFLIVIIMLIPVIIGKTYLYKAVWYNYAGIEDYTFFENRTVATATFAPWQQIATRNVAMPDSLLQYLEQLKTVAVVAIKNRQLVYEKYWDGYTDSSYSGSFSVAKSIVSILVGAAIQEGKIASVQDPVSKYLPEFAQGDRSKVRIVDLLTMSSGSDWNESYSSPMSVTTEAYYGSHIDRLVTSVNIIRDPGTFHSYKSGDTQLLGLIVEKATGKSLSEYTSVKLWKPLGAGRPALWSIDAASGHEKAYCCFNSNARDFARIGQFMLDTGKINGNRIIDFLYWKQSITANNIPDEKGQPCNYYGYQWWIIPDEPEIFYARGILGQYIICIPSQQLVIVRLGKERGTIKGTVLSELRLLVDWGRQLP